MRPDMAMEPATDRERELLAALETERAKNEELETRLAKLRKNRDEANRSRNEETKKAGRLQEELNRVIARLRSKETECERLRSEVFACHEKCSNADIELVMSKKFIAQLKDETARMESVVEAFRNGSKFEHLRSMYEADARKLRAHIRKLDSELAKADRTLMNMRKKWEGVFDDMELELNRERKDHEKEQARKDRKIDSLTNQLKKEKEERRQLHLRMKRLSEDAAAKDDTIAKLERRVHMDQSNSGITSAGSELSGNKENGEPEIDDETGKKKPKPNSRQKSGRKPGGQPGHKGHGRRRLEPDTEVFLPVPDEIGTSPDWAKTGQVKRRQVVGIKLVVSATDYVSEQYQNVHTGKLYSPPFPKDVPNDVNYADDLKATLLYLTHHCNVSNDKARLFLHDVSGGALNISHGFVDGLPRYFSKKVKSRKQEIFDRLTKARSVHADFTVGKLNGKRVAIGICSDGKANVLYIMNHSKGHDAARLLPIKDALVLITDREATFLNEYGIHHQICLEHLRRDLNDVLQNDPDRQWAKEMLDLICTLREKARNWDSRRGLPKEERRMHEQRYDEILDLAEREYDKKPARKTLPQGPNLMSALRRLKKHVLYFLRHPWIPPDNSEAERRARLWKRKQHQCVTFRSDEGIIAACNFLTIVTTARLQGKNIFDELLTIFGEPMPTPAEKDAA